jgi:hypothetical protein
MRHPAIAFALLALSSTAQAEPSLVGGNLGVERGSSGNSDTSTSIGVWARKALQRGVWVQLELSRIDMSGNATPSIMPPAGSSDVLAGSGLLVVDLERRSSIVPILLAGAGLDRATNIVRDVSYAHAELGAGLELRAGSFMLGVDARVGVRNRVAETHRDILTYLETRVPSEGVYKTARLVGGLRF